MAQASDKDLATEAVEIVAEHFRDIKLSPLEFSAQNALIVLLEMIEEDPTTNVAQWMFPATKQSVWKDDGSGDLLQESDEPLHVQFRQAWEDFQASETPVM